MQFKHKLLTVELRVVMDFCWLLEQLLHSSVLHGSISNNNHLFPLILLGVMPWQSLHSYGYAVSSVILHSNVNHHLPTMALQKCPDLAAEIVKNFIKPKHLITFWKLLNFYSLEGHTWYNYFYSGKRSLRHNFLCEFGKHDNWFHWRNSGKQLLRYGGWTSWWKSFHHKCVPQSLHNSNVYTVQALRTLNLQEFSKLIKNLQEFVHFHKNSWAIWNAVIFLNKNS